MSRVWFFDHTRHDILESNLLSGAQSLIYIRQSYIGMSEGVFVYLKNNFIYFRGEVG